MAEPGAAAPGDVFVTGGTGYLGRALIPRLLERGHRVRALVRERSRGRLPAGCEAVVGDALDSGAFRDLVRATDVFVQLVGIPKPAPWKGKALRAVDLASVRASVLVATSVRVRSFVYVSVAHPAPVMRAYVHVRREGEALIRAADFSATILRPWYITGPGHRWPNVLRPLYWLAERFPPTREGAYRLGLVTLKEMVGALVEAVEKPAEGMRLLTVEDIRRIGRGAV